MSLASNLVMLRSKAKLYQHELSDKSGVSRNTIISIEKGRMKYPRTSTVLALADALGVDHADLVAGEG